FRGIPANAALEPRQLGNGLDELLDGRGDPRRDIDELAALVALRSAEYGNTRVLNVDEVADRPAGAPGDHLTQSRFPGLVMLADQGGDDVGVVQVEIIVRAVQVAGDQYDRVETVLPAVRSCQHGTHGLSERVRGAFFLGVTFPECGLGDRAR